VSAPATAAMTLRIIPHLCQRIVARASRANPYAWYPADRLHAGAMWG
jgi:hypothetical protein